MTPEEEKEYGKALDHEMDCDMLIVLNQGFRAIEEVVRLRRRVNTLREAAAALIPAEGESIDLMELANRIDALREALEEEKA